jgi:hypothetical protein
MFLSDGPAPYTDDLTPPQRLVPISTRFFDHVTAYLDTERPVDAGTDQLFVVLKRPRRGQPLTPAGLDEVLDGARRAARQSPTGPVMSCGTPA